MADLDNTSTSSGNENSSATTIIFKTVNYSDFKYVALVNLHSIPNKNNYKSIIPAATSENLSNSNVLTLLDLVGGEEYGTVVIADKELVHGIEYSYDEDNNLILDENNNPIILNDNGILFHKERTLDILRKVFNAIIVYSTEIDEETGTPAIAMVTILKSSISFEKVINFCVRYIITINLEYIRIVFDYFEEYQGSKKHSDSYSITKTLMDTGHKYLANKVVQNNPQKPNEDYLNVSEAAYNEFLKTESVTFFPIESGQPFSPYIKESEKKIEVMQEYKISKFSDNTIRSAYNYFYYNNYAVMKVIKEGIHKDDGEHYGKEDIEELNTITPNVLRKHIKLGFGEITGPYLYTWFSTSAFIYVILYGSNNNNNIDIFRLENKNNYQGMNEENYNLIVGKYADRVYFTIEGDLHVCTPMFKDKLSIVANQEFIDRSNEELILEEPDIFDFGNYDVSKEFNLIIEDIENNNSEEFMLTREQIYIYMMSKRDDLKQHITSEGLFKYSSDNVGTDGVVDRNLISYSTAVEFVNANGGIDLFNETDRDNLIKYVKKPLDKVFELVKYFDDLVKKCDDYKVDTGKDAVEIPYVKQFCEQVKDLLDSDFSLGATYKTMWVGADSQSGIKYSVIFNYLKTGLIEWQEPDDWEEEEEWEAPVVGTYYKEFSKDVYEKLYRYLNIVIFREKITSAYIAVNYSSQLDLFFSGFANRVLELNPTDVINDSRTYFQKYMSSIIYEKDNIFDIEESVKAFFDSKVFEVFYNFIVADTLTTDYFVLRQYLLSKVPEGDFEEQKRLNEAISSDIIIEFNEKFLDGKIEATKDKSRLWGLDGIKELNKFYKEICTFKLNTYVSYNDEDSVYFNHEYFDKIPVTERHDKVPYRYGFSYPDYIFDKDWSNFTTPEHPAETPVDTYYSKAAMEKELVVPVVDGNVKVFSELNDILKPTANFTVSTDSEKDELLRVDKTIDTFESLQSMITLKGVVENYTDLVPAELKKSRKSKSVNKRLPVASNGDIFYVINEDKYYIYNDGEYSEFLNYPKINTIYRTEDTASYYILKLTEGRDNLEWVEHSYPQVGNYVYVEDSRKYYKVESKDDDLILVKFVLVDLDEYKNQFINKVYLVEDTNTSYKFNGYIWVRVKNKYDIEEGAIYEVLNKVEIVDVELSNFKKESGSLEFVPISSSNSDSDEEVVLPPNADSLDQNKKIFAFNYDDIFGNIKVKLSNITLTDQIPNKNITIKGGGLEEDITVELTFEGVSSDDSVAYQPIVEKEILLETLSEDGFVYIVFDEGVDCSIISSTYAKEIEPGDEGVKYYQWNGESFDLYDMVIIPAVNCANFALGPVYFNFYLQGTKLDVDTALFKGINGEALKVTQFEFSDIGDIVLVHNAKNDGQSTWGGICSRLYIKSIDEKTNKSFPTLIGNSVVMSDDINDVFNWENIYKINWSYDSKEGVYKILDGRLFRVKNMYEISKSHYENLVRYYDPKNIIFSNSLTACIDTLKDGSKKLNIFSKNIRMVQHFLSVPYNDIKIDINNYFLVIKNIWCDTIYHKFVDMMSGINKSYNNHYLVSNRGMVIFSINNAEDEKDEWIEISDVSGAYSYFNIIENFDESKITNFFEANSLPKREIL